MTKGLLITNYLGDSLYIDLARPDLSGFLVKSIDGLGPPKASINTKKSATKDGSNVNSTSLEDRNIVLDLVFQETATESIEDLRLKSYKFFPNKKLVSVIVETDNRTAEAIGRVESNEPDIFSKQSGCQISILCSDPYFYDASGDGYMTTIFFGTKPTFSFPFSNKSLTEKKICMGIIENKTENVVTYDGDAETGLTIIMHAMGAVSNISIYNTATREFIKINSTKLAAIVGSDIIAGDDIVITTSRNEKTVTLLRAGVMYNILNSLDRSSSWFQLVKGDNVFGFLADSGATNLQFRITNKLLYLGV